MLSDDALGRLRAQLRDAGVNPDSPSADDVQRTWKVIRSFAAEPVEDAEPRDQDGDGILAQYGTYEWGDGEHFELDMTRQFIFDDEDGTYYRLWRGDTWTALLTTLSCGCLAPEDSGCGP